MNTNATQTIADARRLKVAMNSKGHELSLRDAYQLARAAQSINVAVDAELKRQARDERIRGAMVAGWCDDMRSVGYYDGE